MTSTPSKKIVGSANSLRTEVPILNIQNPPSPKTKKRYKSLPTGISKHDNKVLANVKRRAHCLDIGLFSCCGIRFGWSSCIGIIPGVGDIIDAIMAVMVVWMCQKVEGGLPANLLYRMYFNIFLDFSIGLVPFVGDIADILFRANMRNAGILENHLQKRGIAVLAAGEHVV